MRIGTDKRLLVLAVLVTALIGGNRRTNSANVAAETAAPSPSVHPIGQNADPITLQGCLVTLANEARVPALASGPLAEIAVKLGDEIAAGDLICRVNDERVQSTLEIAEARLEGAQNQADSDINEDYRRESFRLAELKLKAANAANERRANTIPAQDIAAYDSAVTVAELGIKQAEFEKELADSERKVADAQKRAAEDELARHQVRSPLGGVVVDLPRELGEFVQVGEAIAHVVRMDVLRVSAHAKAVETNAAQLGGRTAKITITLEQGRQFQVAGQIIYCASIIDTDGTFRVVAEIENTRDAAGWVIKPGMDAVMTIEDAQN